MHWLAVISVQLSPTSIARVLISYHQVVAKRFIGISKGDTAAVAVFFKNNRRLSRVDQTGKQQPLGRSTSRKFESFRMTQRFCDRVMSLAKMERLALTVSWRLLLTTFCRRDGLIWVGFFCDCRSLFRSITSPQICTEVKFKLWFSPVVLDLHRSYHYWITPFLELVRVVCPNVIYSLASNNQ